MSNIKVEKILNDYNKEKISVFKYDLKIGNTSSIQISYSNN